MSEKTPDPARLAESMRQHIKGGNSLAPLYVDMAQAAVIADALDRLSDGEKPEDRFWRERLPEIREAVKQSRDGAGVEANVETFCNVFRSTFGPSLSISHDEARDFLRRFASSLESARARAEAERDRLLKSVETFTPGWRTSTWDPLTSLIVKHGYRAGGGTYVEMVRNIAEDRDAARAEAARLRAALAEVLDTLHHRGVDMAGPVWDRACSALSGPGAKTGDDDA